jgi:transcriptional regulator NrdR family protein
MTVEQEREIARRIEARLKETVEEHISNDEHWEIVMEVLRETRKNDYIQQEDQLYTFYIHFLLTLGFN